ILLQALQSDGIELHLGETHLHIRSMEAVPLDRNPDVIQSCAAGLARSMAKTFLLAELPDVDVVIGRPSIRYADVPLAPSSPPVEHIDITAAHQHGCGQILFALASGQGGHRHYGYDLIPLGVMHALPWSGT